MKTHALTVATAASAIALVFTSCKSKEEQAREERLEQEAENLEANAAQLRREGDTAADAIRRNGNAIASTIKKDAVNTRKAIEKRADELEDNADSIREKK